MNNLSKEEIDFLQHHAISLNSIFDAKGQSNSLYKAKMKSENKIVAYNAVPCKEKGHKLRTRSNHCILCNPARIEFQKRNDDAGIVYIAGSQKIKIIKIGFTKRVEIREKDLNRTKYGNTADWEILLAVNCLNAGKLEFAIKEKLKKFTVSKSYYHDSKSQEAGELYKCSYDIAKVDLKELLQREEFSSEITIEKIGASYNFK